jgi:hypothetical protein
MKGLSGYLREHSGDHEYQCTQLGCQTQPIVSMIVELMNYGTQKECEL